MYIGFQPFTRTITYRWYNLFLTITGVLHLQFVQSITIEISLGSPKYQNTGTLLLNAPTSRNPDGWYSKWLC